MILKINQEHGAKIRVIVIQKEKRQRVFSTGAMGALAPAILKNRLLAPTIFGHFSTVGKNCGC